MQSESESETGYVSRELRWHAPPAWLWQSISIALRNCFTCKVMDCFGSAAGQVHLPRKFAMRRRSGYVMVLFAMLLFGIMAMAALVIDIGFARLAQRQMQSAADTAALEGLRGKGSADHNYSTRQSAAEAFVEWQFDNNLNSADGDDGIAGQGGAFGAGPLVELTGGVGQPELWASQRLDVDPQNAVYKPILQLGNERANEFRISMQRGGVVNSDADLFGLGGTVPLLFARGSLVDRRLVGDGITVRALGIAEARNALKVGMPAGDFPGAIAIGYNQSDIALVSPQILDAAKTIVGQPVSIIGDAPPPSDGYFSVIADVQGLRVIGFGWIERGVPIRGGIAPGNAVSRLSEVWRDLDPATRDVVLQANSQLADGLKVSSPKGRR